MVLKASKAGTRRRKVVIIAYPGVKLMDVCGPLQAFSDAQREDGSPAYEVLLVSEAGGAVRTDTSARLETLRLDARTMAAVDTLLIAGADLVMPPELTASLRARLARYLERPRRLGSICTGAFILAQLGVLDGREATTHWAACARFAQMHPAVRLKPDAIFVTSGQVWTSAGVSAGIDMALAMIQDDLDHLTALNVARGMVLFLKRPGGQSQFSVELRQQMHDARGRFDELHDWIRDHLQADLSVPALARAAKMSPRNFTRVYSRETGDSPAQAVEKLRTEAARRFLESGQDAIQVIARKTGFGDDERMRRAFVKTYGIAPQEYRSRFGRS